MSEQPDSRDTDTADALEMTGLRPPSVEISPPHKSLEHRRGQGLEEKDNPAWIKFSTAFKQELPDISGTALKVWIFLALSIDYTGKTFPGIRTIATGIGMSHQTVIDAIAELEERQLCTVDRSNGRHSLYKIVDDYVKVGRGEPVKKLDRLEGTGQVKTQTGQVEAQNRSSGLDSNKKELEELEYAATKNSATQKRGDILDGMLHFSREHRPELEMRQRFEQALRLSPDWDKHAPRDTWEGFDLWLLEKDRAGQTIEHWASWWTDDDFQAKQTIHLTPDKIKKGWLLAFPVQSELTSQEEIVTIPERGAPPPDRAEYEATLEKLHAISAARRAADHPGPAPAP